MKALFFISICFILYTYFIYPLFICLISALFRKKLRQSIEYRPNIDVIISVYNEGRFLEEKVSSIYNSTYPADKIRLLIGLDACTDQSLEVLNKLKPKYPNMHVFYFNERRGKPAVLNDLINKIERCAFEKKYQ